MKFEIGQLVIILSPFADIDIYGNITLVSDDYLTLNIRQNWLLKEGWDIVCLVVDGTEMFEFYSVIKYITGKEAIITAPDRNKLHTVEKRRYNRVDCEIGFIGRPVAINDVPINKLYRIADGMEKYTQGKVFSGIVRNIGANGILAETDLILPEGMVFGMKLKVDYFIDCKAVVKRIEKTETGGKCNIGCQFVDMELEYVKAISMFAFREQLKYKRRKLYEQLFKSSRSIL